MRHPILQLLAILGFLLVGLGGAALVWVLPGPFDFDAKLSLVVCLVFALAGLVHLALLALVLRSRANLRAGRGLIGRWHLTAAEWDAFRAFDAERAALGETYRNDFTPRRTTPAGGVEVRFGPRSVLVDGSYQVLGRAITPALLSVDYLPGAPACLEFTRQHTGYKRLPYIRRLRIPIAADAGPAVGAVFNHYRKMTAGLAIPKR